MKNERVRSILTGNVLIIIPAAGASSRMRGADKLMQLVGGEALLARQVRIALCTGGSVVVTLPPDNVERRAVVKALACDHLHVARPEDTGEGIAASIRAGALWAQAQKASGLMIMLADMPEIEGGDLKRMIAAFQAAPEHVLRAVTEDGAKGHPVIFPLRLFAALGQISGDIGARDVLVGEDVSKLRLPGLRAVTDLDTPEDWARWRRKTGG